MNSKKACICVSEVLILSHEMLELALAKTTGQSRMVNPETLITLDTQDTCHRHTKHKHTTKHKQKKGEQHGPIKNRGTNPGGCGFFSLLFCNPSLLFPSPLMIISHSLSLSHSYNSHHPS